MAQSMICLTCGKQMLPKQVDITYMNHTGKQELLVCPSCGRVCVTEAAQQVMRPTEKVLEGHFCEDAVAGIYYQMLSADGKKDGM